MKSLAERMKSRPPPTKEAFKAAFGGTKSQSAGTWGKVHTLEGVEVVGQHGASVVVNCAHGKGVILPKSQVVRMAGDVVVITLWLAEQRGWA